MQNTKEKGSRRREEETKEKLVVRAGSAASGLLLWFWHCAPARVASGAGTAQRDSGLPPLVHCSGTQTALQCAGI